MKSDMQIEIGVECKETLFCFLRPMFGRGPGNDGKTFDARQKIGINDVRQRIGGGTGKS